jgi:geranylgeranyl diphosphate synthase type I
MPAADPTRALRPRIQAVLDDFLDRQRELLGEVEPDLLPLVAAAVDLLAGGKRLRPAFCYWGWRGAGGADDAVVIIRAAACLELFHAAALIHDDLMDGSDLRRGMPSVHRRFALVHEKNGWHGDASRFGNAAALLLGDLCLGWSDELLDIAGLPDAALRRGRPIFERMRTELIGGQYLDVLEQATGAMHPGQAARARRVIRYKSAKYSVEHPLRLGGSLAGASEALLAAYSAYGLSLGEAFQLRDDVLGVFGDPDRTGKPAGDDLREGKRTVLVAYALEHASPAQAVAVETLLGDPFLTGDGVDTLRQIIVDTGALRRVERLVDDLVGAAASALADADITAGARAALTDLITAATVRAG